MKRLLIAILFLTQCNFGSSQEEVIEIINPSFEVNPKAGLKGVPFNTKGWTDCGSIFFSGQTPPDIHLGMDPSAGDDFVSFNVKHSSSDGFTFLGMVTRKNETYEAIGQRLSKPIEAGKCYRFSIDLARSDHYISSMSSKPLNQDPSIIYLNEKTPEAQIKPVILRIYGGSTPCGKRELLAESIAIESTDWTKVVFTFTPNITHKYILFSSFYKVPVLFPYNGNILLDNLSDITRIPCPDEEVVAEEPIKEVIRVKKKEIITEEPVKVTNETGHSNSEPIVASEPQKNIITKPVINKELDRKTIKKGQTINLKNMYFDANAVEINEKSTPTLIELAGFLKQNSGVKIEVGGHTNNRPTHEFCDSLSSERAKSVADFLFRENIPKSQIEYKGYGKRKPIASNKYAEGRKRNQRVEIKVLEVEE